MSPDLRLLAALQLAEALAGEGLRITYCLERASAAHQVARGVLAAAWLAKRIECDRARAAVASLGAGDAQAEDGGR